jgi:hypothetical protein
MFFKMWRNAGYETAYSGTLVTWQRTIFTVAEPSPDFTRSRGLRSILRYVQGNRHLPRQHRQKNVQLGVKPESSGAIACAGCAERREKERKLAA